MPKDEGRRQRRNRPGVALVRSVGQATVAQAPPDGLLKSTIALWEGFWETEEAQATRAVELPMVRRLFELYDERERARRAVRKSGRIVKGSQKQPVANPLLKYIHECEQEIRALEDRLGFSRRAMVSLGAGYASAQRSLDKLNATLEADDDGDGDPRLHAVQ